MSAHTRNVHITSPYITLGQLLKFANIVGSGVEAKIYLQCHELIVNGEVDCRRGRKIYPGDEVQVESEILRII